MPAVPSTTRLLAVVATPLALLCAQPPAAHAQNALGDGRALDANRQVGSGRANPARRSIRQELELRNAIVTGDAPGGTSFRGDVGYRATFDFRGSLPGDDAALFGGRSIYDFERDAFYSGNAVRNIGGIDALQYQFGQSTFGQTSGAGASTNFIVRRPFSGATASSVRGGQTGQPSGIIEVDSFGRTQGGLRSTTEFDLRTREFPEVMGVSQAEGAATRIQTASSLQGIKELSPQNAAFGVEVRSFGFEAQREQEQEQPIPRPTEEVDPLTPHAAVLDSLRVTAERVGATRFDDSFRERPIDPAAEEEPAERVQPSPLLEDAPDEEADALETMIQGLREQILLPDQFREQEDEDAEAQEAADEARRALREADIRLDRLARPGADRNVFALHMRRGEQALAEARWFEAEERFTAALRVEQGEPLAAAGRVHAQLGAGLFVSAGVNLRSLLTAYPEMIPTRYGDDLLPGPDRLALLRTQLRDRIDRGTRVSPHAALLLAYIGYQYDNPSDTREGIEAMRRLAGDDLDGLAELLADVWVDE